MVNRVRHLFEESQQPDYHEFYEVEAFGDTYIVSLSTALFIERHLDSVGAPGWIEFRDLFGLRHRIPLRFVCRITESTPAARAASRAFERIRKDEERADRDPLEDLE